MSAKDDIVIIGAAETDQLGKLPHLSTLGLHLEAARNALADAGMTPADIDGIATIAVAQREALPIRAASPFDHPAGYEVSK